MDESDARSVVHAIFEGESSLPSQLRLVMRLQNRFATVDWFRVAFDVFPEWDPDVDIVEARTDWRDWTYGQSDEG